MTPIARYLLLSFRLFVRQWSFRNVLGGAVALLPVLFLSGMAVRGGTGMATIAPLVFSWIAALGYGFGRSLRGRSVTPGQAQGLIGFSLPITPRVRWMGGLVASGIFGLTLFGSLTAIGLIFFGTWSLESFARPVGIAMIAYLPWAGFAFLGREGAATMSFFGVVCVGVLQGVALDRLEPDMQAFSVWSALLLLGAFLVAPRLEYAHGSRGPGSLRQGLIALRERRRLPALGAPPLSPFRAWERVLMRGLIQNSFPTVFALVAVMVPMVAYWRKPGDPVQAEVLGMVVSTAMLFTFAPGWVPMAVRGAPTISLAPAALLPLPARLLWWGTLLGVLPDLILTIGALMASAVVAALLVGEPIDPTPYQTFLARTPLLIGFVLWLRASWHLGFLLTTWQRAFSIVCAFVAFVGSSVVTIPSWSVSSVAVVSSVALAVSVGVLALLAPRRYPAPV